ncbi:MAG: Rrf2 family transcriptional regulator [Chromatiales bacterium]|nr:Rrf2 family transcriptional regulator [Chromatiales bacterium]
MKLTTKGRYAVTAMLDLTLHGASSPVALSDISDRQDISLSYLEQLFCRLRRNGVVESVHGPGGGYRLARPPAEISVRAVILAVDEPVQTTLCGGDRNCQDGRVCLTHELWEELHVKIEAFLDALSLQDLVDRRFSPPRVSPDQIIGGAWPLTRESDNCPAPAND